MMKSATDYNMDETGGVDKDIPDVLTNLTNVAYRITWQENAMY